MKRIITLLLIILLSFSVVSCKSKQDDENAKAALQSEGIKSYKDSVSYIDEKYSIYELQGPSYFDYIPFEGDTLEDIIKSYIPGDAFIGKVVAVEKIMPKLPLYYLHSQTCTRGFDCGACFTFDKRYEDYFGLHSDIYLYTVQVEKVILQGVTTENTTIYVIGEVEYYETVPVVGEKYLMSGVLMQYGEKTVLKKTAAFNARVDSKGNLEGLGNTYVAKIFNSIGTVENLLSQECLKDSAVQSLAVTNGYEEDYNFSSFGIISSTDPDPNIQKFMADAKKALVIENKFVMNVKPEVYDWPKGYMSEEYEKYYPVKQAESK